MNDVKIMGRIANDLEIKDLDNGKKVLNLSLAINKKDVEPEYIDCVLWDKIAEATFENKKKGDILLINGYLKTEKYSKDGQTHKVTKVVANRVHFDLSRESNKASQNHDER